MKQRLSMIALLGLMMTAQAIVSCRFFVSVRHNVGCEQYDSMSSEGSYCRLHREAVWDYVELSDTKAGQMKRSYAMVRLLRMLKRCQSMACVETEIAVDTIALGFNSIYSSAHQKAVDKLNGATVKTEKVTLCGLESGLRDWVDSLELAVKFDD